MTSKAHPPSSRGHYPKAYLRLDPNADQHPDMEGMVLLMCAAARQPVRGRFQPGTLRRVLSPKRLQAFMTPRPGKSRPDLITMPDGTLYLDGWDEWQEGDITVGERVRRIRLKRSGGVPLPVTRPLPESFYPSEALGVGRKALDVGRSPLDAERGGAALEHPPAGTPAGTAGHGVGDPPPPAAGAPGEAIRHDPTNPLHVRLVERVVYLAQREAAQHGAIATRAEILDVLASVSGTAQGKSLDGNLVGAPVGWIEHSLRVCDTFEAELFADATDAHDDDNGATERNVR